jgi:hypothetical protein
MDHMQQRARKDLHPLFHFAPLLAVEAIVEAVWQKLSKADDGCQSVGANGETWTHRKDFFYDEAQTIAIASTQRNDLARKEVKRWTTDDLG